MSSNLLLGLMTSDALNPETSFLWVLKKHTVGKVENIVETKCFGARQEGFPRNKPAETGVGRSEWHNGHFQKQNMWTFTYMQNLEIPLHIPGTFMRQFVTRGSTLRCTSLSETKIQISLCLGSSSTSLTW